MSMLKDVSSSLNQLSGIAATTKQEKLSVKLSQAERVVSQASDALNLVEGLVSGATISRLLSLFGIQSDPRGLQFTLEVQGLPVSALGVLSFKLTEKYSELYCLSLKLTSLDSEIDFKSVVDNSVKFKVWQNGELLRQVNGMVVSFEQGDSGSSQTHYGMEVYPDLWRTTLRRNSRIFQQQDIQSIVSTLLTEHGIVDYAFVFRNSHPVREFCVQYQESDFDFLQRLTAEEGIFYYFEQGDGQHKVVFSDSAETLSEKVCLSYNVNRNAQLQEKVVSGFRRREQVRPSSVKLKDYTFKKPSWTAQFSRFATDIENQRAGYEHYDYPGRFKDEAQGKAFTQYRLESLRHDAHLGQGESNGPSLQVGKLLVLSHHPRAENNTAWQLIKIIHEGRQPQSAEQESGGTGTYYDNAFQVVPRHQTWRPNQRTKPRVEGPQIAMVVGPKGEEIYTDNYGRIRLQFLWDRYGHHDDHSSCWIRVTQPWAGKGWGMIAIPRVGQEVLVDFLDGDPDQPIVTGRTYHANNLPPGALPGAKTQMNLMSQTYKGGGYNGIMMDDATNGQKLDLHAQRDMNTVVLNDRSTTVMNNHLESIGEDQKITIKQNRIKSIGGDETLLIGQDSTTVIGGDYVLLAGEDILLESISEDITLETQNAKMVLSKDGHIDFMAKDIFIMGNKVTFNPEATWQELTNKIAELRSEGKHELADRLDRERKALQHAALAKAAYEPIGSPPPPGWKEISNNPDELAKYGLLTDHFPENQDFQARFFVPDPAVFGDEMKPTVAFRGTRFDKLKDWENNVAQGVGRESEYYNQAIDIGVKIKESGNADNIEFVGHSLGGGLASAASRASGAKATTFNAAGLNNATVARKTEVIPSEITTYRVKGEILTRLQEFDGIDLTSTPLSNYGDIVTAIAMPNATYTTRYDLPAQTKAHWFSVMNSVDDHGMDKVIQALNNEFSETIQSIP
ncbi:type VI secretion system tip protein TssI/VgrG [Pasteurella sp. PK-2025]|uniref:type VI secretion system tip protein TssI/VgrG n=2 Tax=unclassified Pasteurella TaxID=2621516 RepID=UPI003C786A88